MVDSPVKMVILLLRTLPHSGWPAWVMKFRKRFYKNPKDLLLDLCYPIGNRQRLKEASRVIPAAFRERMMLAVTAVHGCRYCSYFHTRQALQSGIESEEIGRLLAGDVTDCPAEEAVAVLYAQHWAESDAKPDSVAVLRLQQTYGSEKAEAIDVLLHMIRLGNLLGNTWDFLLYILSFGRFRR
jgi:AhpD family alkylhydroperoxidase